MQAATKLVFYAAAKESHNFNAFTRPPLVKAKDFIKRIPGQIILNDWLAKSINPLLEYCKQASINLRWFIFFVGHDLPP